MTSSSLVYKRGEVYGLRAILKELRKRRERANLDHKAQIRVGYSASYAVPVHERLDVYHPNGQAKYLEEPLRIEEPEMQRIVTSKLRGRHTLRDALLAAGQHLLKVSQELVPVDTGALKASGFVRTA